jgi:hypothetical protein
LQKKGQQLDTLLATCGLTSTVHLPTRIQNSSVSVSDSVFIDVTKNEIYIICPLINGLSNSNAQIIKLINFKIQEQYNESPIIRNFNE